MDCFVSVPFCSNLIGKVAKGVNSGFLASIGAVSCFWGEKEAFTPAMIDDDLPFMVTAAAIATDKVALLDGRLGTGNQPLALALLVNGDIGIDNQTIKISERELESLAEARASQE